MSDHDDTEDLSSAPALDRITAAIALCDLAAELHDLAIKNKTYKARLRQQAKLEKENAAAQAKLAAAQAKAAELVANAERDVKAIHEDAQRRLEAVAAAEEELVLREQKIARLEAAWRYLGEPQDVLSGFRSPEATPLAKARRAHGQPPGKDPDRLFSEPAAAPAMRIDAVSDTSDDERADRHGTPFLGELTRDVSHKQRGAA